MAKLKKLQSRGSALRRGDNGVCQACASLLELQDLSITVEVFFEQEKLFTRRLQELLTMMLLNKISFSCNPCLIPLEITYSIVIVFELHLELVTNT